MIAPSEPIILAPTDMSAASIEAVAYAVGLARRLQGRLVLLHVLSQQHVDDRVEAGEFVDVQIETEHARLHHWYVTSVPKAAREGVPTEFRVAIGNAADEILGFADTVPPELIVMATHGRTGLQRALLGSVAEAIVRQAPCPVLTLRTRVPVAA
jgi:nucleotide-binding universal stress UspA family protein